MAHIPVLLHETLTGLMPQKGDTVLDGTAGAGGHALAFCREVGERGTIIALDADEQAVARATENLKGCGATVHVLHENFRNLKRALESLGTTKVDRILFDLGVSSFQLDQEGRGFSFRRDEPLAMTFAHVPDPEALTAREIVNEWEEEHIADIIYGYGEERYSRTIARAMVAARRAHPIETTHQLVEIIRSAVPARYANGRGIHFATRTFQALRITVNDELGALKQGLEDGWAHIKEGGRIAVISFHSLEDRIVKQFFKEREREGTAMIITKKPVEASDEEQKENPRARSAKLRIAQ